MIVIIFSSLFFGLLLTALIVRHAHDGPRIDRRAVREIVDTRPRFETIDNRCTVGRTTLR